MCGQDFGRTYNGYNQADLNLHHGAFLSGLGREEIAVSARPSITKLVLPPSRGFCLRLTTVSETSAAAVRAMAVGGSVKLIAIAGRQFKTLNFDSSYWFLVSR